MPSEPPKPAAGTSGQTAAAPAAAAVAQAVLPASQSSSTGGAAAVVPNGKGESVAATEATKNAELLAALFAIIAGAIAFLPSVLGAIKPPYVADWLLLTFWSAGAISLIFLAFAIFIVKFVNDAATPYRSMGLGFWTGAAALVALVTYIAVNGIADRMAKPIITSVQFEPITPNAGDTVKLQVDATDQDEDQLTYEWFVGTQRIGSGKVTYWRTPPKGGAYAVTVRVTDAGTERTVARKLDITTNNKVDRMQTDEMIRQAWMSARPAVAKRYPRRLAEFDSVLARGYYSAMVSPDFEPVDSRTTQQLLANVAINTVQTLPERDLFNLLNGIKRPCCAKFRILWPFCDRRC